MGNKKEWEEYTSEEKIVSIKFDTEQEIKKLYGL